jgi:hypothetical protein
MTEVSSSLDDAYHLLQLSQFSGTRAQNTTLAERKSMYERVRGAFLKLAIKHHPDTTASSSESREGGSIPSNGLAENEAFIRVREAFELIRLDLLGKTARESSNDFDLPSTTSASLSDYQKWYKKEITANFLSFEMSDSVREAVIDEYYRASSKSSGTKDGLAPLRGGTWEMARQLAELEQRDKLRCGQERPMQLIAGGIENSENSHTATIRRKRRRN